MLKGFMASLGIVQPQADTFCGYTCELNWSICFVSVKQRPPINQEGAVVILSM